MACFLTKIVTLIFVAILMISSNTKAWSHYLIVLSATQWKPDNLVKKNLNFGTSGAKISGI